MRASTLQRYHQAARIGYALERRMPTYRGGMYVGGLFGDIGHFLSDACSFCGRVLEFGGQLLTKIPIVGGIFHAAFGIITLPLRFVESVMSGRRIDSALIDMAKNTLSAVREVAPYITTVIGVIPGLGTAVSMAIAGGLAIASGIPIDQALIAAVKSAIPGGALAQAVFSIGVAAVRGENIVQASLQAGLAALPGQAKELLGKLSQAAGTAGIELYEQIQGLIPAEAMKGFQLACSFGTGWQIQESVLGQMVEKVKDIVPNTLSRSSIATVTSSVVHNLGIEKIAQTPMLQKAMALGIQAANATGRASPYEDPALIKRAGFEIGVGVMAQSGYNEKALALVRSTGITSDDARMGFDLAVATWNGAVSAKPLPKTDYSKTQFLPPAVAAVASAGYYAVAGIVNAAAHQKAAVVATVQVNPLAAEGARLAMQITSSQLNGSAAEVLTSLRAIAARLAVGDPMTTIQIAKIREAAKAGDPKSQKMLAMLELAGKANIEDAQAQVRAAQTAAVSSPHVDTFFERFWQEVLSVPRSFTKGSREIIQTFTVH